MRAQGGAIIDSRSREAAKERREEERGMLEKAQKFNMPGNVITSSNAITSSVFLAPIHDLAENFLDTTVEYQNGCLS